MLDDLLQYNIDSMPFSYCNTSYKLNPYPDFGPFAPSLVWIFNLTQMNDTGFAGTLSAQPPIPSRYRFTMHSPNN